MHLRSGGRLFHNENIVTIRIKINVWENQRKEEKVDNKIIYVYFHLQDGLGVDKTKDSVGTSVNYCSLVFDRAIICFIRRYFAYVLSSFFTFYLHFLLAPLKLRPYGAI